MGVSHDFSRALPPQRNPFKSSSLRDSPFQCIFHHKYCIRRAASVKLGSMKNIISTILVLAICGCSTAELIYVDDIRPWAASGSVANASDEDGGGTYLYDVDAYDDTCCTLDDNGQPDVCVTSRIAEHRATITFINDTAIPDSTTANSSAGTAQINNIDIEYTSHQNGPDLPKHSVATNIKLPAGGEPTSITADLVNTQTKKYFRDLNDELGSNKVSAAQSYTAKYIFTGTNDLRIVGEVVLNIGDYPNCGSENPYSFSFYGASLLSSE